MPSPIPATVALVTVLMVSPLEGRLLSLLRPNHPVLRDADLRDSVLEALDDDPTLAAIALRESDLDPGAVSPKGARGMYQMMPQIARFTRRLPGGEACTLDTLRGQTVCTRVWFEHCREKCGTELGAHVMYLTGGCSSSSKRVVWRARDRIRLTEWLRGSPRIALTRWPLWT